MLCLNCTFIHKGAKLGSAPSARARALPVFFSLEASKYPKIPGLEFSKYPKIAGLEILTF